MLQEAEHDLEAIFRYILGSGNPGAAKDMIRLIRQACDSLCQMPERGHVPPELARADYYEYRQIIVKPYRIIYQVVESCVYIFGIIHGRRNVDEVLRQRLSM
jgi:toxin ParE1/3/4